MTRSEAERIAVLEANQVHMNASIENVNAKLDDLADNLKILNDLLQNARGARWAVIALATLGGGGGLVGLAAALGVPFPK